MPAPVTTKCGASRPGCSRRQCSPSSESSGNTSSAKPWAKVNRKAPSASAAAASTRYEVSRSHASVRSSQRFVPGRSHCQSGDSVPGSPAGTYRSREATTMPSGPCHAPRALDVQRELTDGSLFPLVLAKAHCDHVAPTELEGLEVGGSVRSRKREPNQWGEGSFEHCGIVAHVSLSRGSSNTRGAYACGRTRGSRRTAHAFGRR